MLHITACTVGHKMIALYVTEILIFSSMAVLASPYSKYGRSCDDITCLQSEICVLRTDPCIGARPCGRYPTCQSTRPSQPPASCAQVRCPQGQYCSLNETYCSLKPCRPVPTCVLSGSSVLKPTTKSPWIYIG
ncbi:uncharacterized protein [Anabrus simplex]|uniref:uncharacterized protein n=1 Tax=Anabrus simplex TaxID=316456 RepID=UPI0035A28985